MKQLFFTFNGSIANKLAKARKTRKSPGTLGFKKFGPGKLRVQQVWGQNIFINFLAELDNSKNFFLFFFQICFFKQPANQLTGLGAGDAIPSKNTLLQIHPPNIFLYILFKRQRDFPLAIPMTPFLMLVQVTTVV